MKKTWIVILVIVGIFVFLSLPAIPAYNSLVTRQEAVSTAWANVEAQYQRRADLIPNLVATVRGYATHEQQTLTDITAARASATQMRVDPANLTPEALAEYNRAQGAVGSAIGRLLMIQENYPELKANQNFIELQSQLEGTENRINQARRDFNAAAQTYNTARRSFPNNIIASILGFDAKPYFDSQPGADVAPRVEF